MTKPIITPKTPECFDIRFPCGATASVYRCGDGSSHLPEWRWDAVRATGERLAGSRPMMDSDRAFVAAWCWVRPAPDAIEGYTLATCEASDRIDRNVYTKELRSILKKRTGRTWSVKGGTGTAWSWLDICAPPARLVDGYRMTPDDESLLAAVLGESHIGQHYQIPPTGGYRAHVMARCVGLDASQIRRQEHGWD